MKTGLLLILCVFLSFQAGAQTSKKERKLYQLLEEARYDKLKVKSIKILEKGQRNIHANYAMSMCYLHQFKITRSEIRKKNNVKKALRHLAFLPIDISKEFKAASDSLHYLLRIMAFDSSLKTSTNNQYRDWLLVYFNDSVPKFSIPKAQESPILVLDSIKIGDSLRYTMLKMAKELEGVKYVYAGTDPKKGFDCSGFTQYVYHQVGFDLPHNAQLQSNLSDERIRLEQLRPGDLIFFGSWSGSTQNTAHAGIIFDIADNEITVIHCVSGGVRIEGKNSSWDRYWVDRFLFGISMDTIARK